MANFNIQFIFKKHRNNFYKWVNIVKLVFYLFPIKNKTFQIDKQNPGH